MALGREAVLLEHLKVPGLEAGRAQHDAPAHLQGAVELPNLAGRGVCRRVEPVHAVHDDGHRQGAGCDARDDLVNLIGVDAEAVEGALAREAGVGLAAQVVRVALLGELAVEADEVIRVVAGDVGVLNHGIKGVNHEVPDGVGARVLGGGLRATNNVRDGVVRLNDGQLVLGHAQRRPEERLLAHDEFGHETGQKGGADLVAPDFALLVERLGGEQGFHGRPAAKDARDPAEDADAVLGAARVVQAALALGEDVVVAQPVLECAARQVG